MNPEREYIEKIIGETPEEQYENSQEELSLDKIISKNIDKPDLRKKDSSINIVVSRSKKDIEKVEELLAKKFSDPEWEKIKGREIEKTEKQIRIINLINDETNKLRKKYGLEEFDIGPDNVKLLGSEDFDRLYGTRNEYFLTRGMFKPMIQSGIYRQTEEDTAMKFGHISYHELHHFKNFQKILSANKDEDISKMIPERRRREEKNEQFMHELPNTFDAYKFIRQKRQKNIDLYMIQCGLMIEFRKKNKERKMAVLTKDIPNAEDFSDFLREGGRENYEDCFINIDEAVTEESTIRFQKNILSKHPDFQKEAALIREYVEGQKKNGVEINPDEIISARKIPVMSMNDFESIEGELENKGGFIFLPVKTKPTFKGDERNYIIKVETASYAKQREILNLLIDKLYEKNKDKFKDREDVFDLFVKSSYTGNIVGKGSWGRLVADTYGSKALQKLAKYDKNIHSTKKLKKFVEGLK